MLLLDAFVCVFYVNDSDDLLKVCGSALVRLTAIALTRVCSVWFVCSYIDR